MNHRIMYDEDGIHIPTLGEIVFGIGAVALMYCGYVMMWAAAIPIPVGG